MSVVKHEADVRNEDECKIVSIVPKPRGKQGHSLNVEEKQRILEALQRFKKSLNMTKAVQQCSKAMGCSERVIYNIVKEEKGGGLRQPKRTKCEHIKSHSRQLKYDYAIRARIRQVLHDFLKINIPTTINAVLGVINTEPDMPQFKRSTLHSLIKEIGFVHISKHVSFNNKGIFLEKHDIIEWRHHYLKTVIKARAEKRHVIYTLANVDRTINFQINSELHSKNLRIAILHAASEDNIIEGTKLIVTNYNKNEIDKKTYQEWFFNNLLPNIPSNSIIVLDDSNYYMQKLADLPNSTWSKRMIANWLWDKDVQVIETALSKDKLLQLVNDVEAKFDLYEIYQKCNRLGFEILQLPRYHKELNPMEILWTQVKDFIRTLADKCGTKLIEDVINEGFSNITNKHLANSFNNVRITEESMWLADTIQDKM